MSDRDPRIEPLAGDALRTPLGALVRVVDVMWFESGVSCCRVHYYYDEAGASTIRSSSSLHTWREQTRAWGVVALGEHASTPEIVVPVMWKNDDGTWRIRRLTVQGPMGPGLRWDDGTRPTSKEIDRMARELVGAGEKVDTGKRVE